MNRKQVHKLELENARLESQREDGEADANAL